MTETWNRFLDLISDSRAASDPIRTSAHFAFLYESQVQNGGHLQYFENATIDQLKATTISLQLLGASCQHEVLQEAQRAYFGKPRKRPETAQEYVALALEGEFDEYDMRFHACSPNLIEVLQAYLETHHDLLFPAI